MATVYLIQQPTLRNGRPMDLSRAQEFGVLLPLLTMSDKPSHAPELWRDRLAEMLAGYTPADFLLWVGGDPLALVFAAQAAAAATGGRFSFLRWERLRDNDGQRSKSEHGEFKGFYVPVLVDLYPDVPR